MGGPTTKEYFIADHPFLFTIQDQDNDAIIFIGRFKTNLIQPIEQNPNIVAQYATNTAVISHNIQNFSAIIFIAFFKYLF